MKETAKILVASGEIDKSLIEVPAGKSVVIALPVKLPNNPFPEIWNSITGGFAGLLFQAETASVEFDVIHYMVLA